jgi:hypothetical protein
MTAKTKLKLRDITRYNKNIKLRSKGVKRACELIYTAERQALHDVGLAGLRLKPGSSHIAYNYIMFPKQSNTEKHIYKPTVVDL